MKYFLLLLSPFFLYSQQDGYEKTYKQLISSGKIKKSKTEYFDNITGVYSNYYYGFSFESPKNWKTDNGPGLIDVFRTFKRDSGVSVKIGVMSSKIFENKSIFQTLDLLGKDYYKSNFIKKINNTPNEFSIDKIYFRNLQTLKLEITYTEKFEEGEIEWFYKVLMFYRNNIQFTLGITVPNVYYQINPDYYDNLFYKFGLLQDYEELIN